MYGSTDPSATFDTGDRVIVTDGPAAMWEVSARVATGDRGRVVHVDRGIAHEWVKVHFDGGITWYVPSEFLARVGA